MKFAAAYIGVVALLVILATAEGAPSRQRLTDKIAQHRLRRQAAAQQSNVHWWYRRAADDCDKRWESLTVTACGNTRTFRVPTCEGQCHSESSYEEQPNGDFTFVRDCNCCFIADGSIDWLDNPFPGCAESVRIPKDLECVCNKCLRDVELRDGAPFSIA